MFIFLDQSIVESIHSSDENSSLSIDTVIRVARLRRQGKHLVSGTRQTLKSLSECESLTPLVRAIYANLGAELVQLKHALDEIKMKVKVVSNSNVFTKAVVNNQVLVTVSIDFFDELSLESGTKLLCEHLIDTKFYIKGAECYQSWAKYLPMIPLYFEGVLGGGNATSNVYLSYKQGKDICLCIVDSDRASPNSSCGETARQVEVVERENSNHLCNLVVIQQRELENLLPIKLMEIAIDRCPSREPVIDDYFNNLENPPRENRKFLDVKNGLKLGQLYHSSNNDLIEYWREFKNSGSFSSEYISLNCVEEPSCTSVSDCECFVVRGLGDHILTQSVAASNMRSLPKLVEMFPDHLKSDWEELAQTIFAWGCGSRKMRVV